ncbi:MAG: M48 family metallopeptidase [Proteobacteria bacterium]|nr:M48 family metallopeptidase [Pseudomonadota bacterium]
MASEGIRALFYDGHSSRARPVRLAFTSSSTDAALTIDDGTQPHTLPLRELRLGERVGGTPRLVTLPDGASLEIQDNDAFDAWLRAAAVRTPEQAVRWLESRWQYALFATALTVLVSIALLRWGLPALTTRAVRFVPPSVDALIARDSLRALDLTTFGPSQLSQDERQHLTALFAEVAHDAQPPGLQFRIEFRKGNRVGANAFALPSGVVVLTDELVGFARNDDELRGVFAHEVGHLRNRHAMRMLMQGSGSALLLVGVFGDVSAASSLTAVAPTLLVSQGYSRDFEREADAFAFTWLAAHGIGPEHLSALLRRLPGAGSGGYLESHPDLEERVEAAHQAAAPPTPGPK